MRGTPISYFDYSGGRNTQSAPYLLENTQCRDDLNVRTSLSGDIEKRPGFVTLSGATLTGSPCEATLVHSLFPSNTSTKSLVGAVRTSSTDSIVKLTTGGVATNLKTGLTANTRWYFAQAEVNGEAGPIFGLNGVDDPIRWDGAAGATSKWEASSGTVPKAGKYLIYFSSRLWCAVGSRLLYSGLTGSSPDPLEWDADNYVDLEPNDGQVITGIGVVGQELIVFKARKTYRIYDPITAANQRISGELGCVAHRSIVQTPEGLFFLSEDQGVCKTDGTSIKPISDQIQPDFTRISAERKPEAAATLDGRRYLLSISLGGTRNDHTLEYDLTAKSWWLHDCASNQYALLDPSGSPVRYSADSLSSARVSKAFVAGTYSDNGSKYKGGAFWTSPWYAWGVGGGGLNPHVTKRIAELRVDGVGNWETSVATEFSDEFEAVEGEVWQSSEAEPSFFGGEGTFGEGGVFGTNPSSTIDRRYYTPALGRSFSFKYTNDDEDNFRIHSSTFLLTPRSD